LQNSIICIIFASAKEGYISRLVSKKNNKIMAKRINHQKFEKFLSEILDCPLVFPDYGGKRVLFKTLDNKKGYLLSYNYSNGYYVYTVELTSMDESTNTDDFHNPIIDYMKSLELDKNPCIRTDHALTII
jgi:hypothetical protein